MQTIRTDAIAGMVQIIETEMPPRPAVNDIGMHLEHDGAGRIIRQGLPQHRSKTVWASPTEGDRTITS